MPIWSLQHGDLRPDALEPDDAVDPIALDRRLAVQLESELGEERHRVRDVIDDYAHVVHPPDRHVLDDRHATSPSVNCPGERAERLTRHPRHPLPLWRRGESAPSARNPTQRTTNNAPFVDRPVVLRLGTNRNQTPQVQLLGRGV